MGDFMRTSSKCACVHVAKWHFLMYTCVHAQQKHVLCGQEDKRETHPKKNFTQRHTWTKNPKKVEVRTCVHAHTLKEITALGCDFFSSQTVTQIRKRTLGNTIVRMGVFCVSVDNTRFLLPRRPQVPGYALSGQKKRIGVS